MEWRGRGGNIEGGMNVAFSEISNALFWQIPTKQPSLPRGPSNIQPSPVPSATKKEHTSNICHAHGQGAVAGGDKVMMLLRHESSRVLESDRGHHPSFLLTSST